MNRTDVEKRIHELKEKFLCKPEICIERGKYYTESFRETEGYPEVIRKARAFENVLKKMTIRLVDGEVLAGLPTSKLRGSALSPELNGGWYVDDLERISSREWDQFAPIPENDKKEIINICEYWKGRSQFDRWEKMIPPEIVKYNNKVQMGGAFAGNNQYYGHCSFDYEMVLEKGLKQILDEVTEEKSKLNLPDMDGLTKYEYLTAMEISLNAAIAFCGRYETLVSKLAEQEKDTGRREELLKLADACKRVPVFPAETFYEAVQSVCMTYMLIMLEGAGTGIGYLRADQYLYPYYKKDMEAGKLTKEEALLYISSLYIKLNTPVIAYSSSVVSAFCGFSLSANITLGGIDKEGNNAVNELSYLFLEAEEIVSMNSEDIVVRVHPSNPDSFVKKACETAKALHGKVKFVSDEVIIENLVSLGRPRELSNDYAITGCNTPVIPGYSLDTPGGIVSLPLLLELALNNGKMRLTGEQLGPETGDPKLFTSYEEVWNAFLEQAKALIPICSVFKNVDKYLFSIYNPVPFQSSLMHGPKEKGKDLYNGGVDYICYSMSLGGAPNVGDGLAAIKKVVFEDHALTMADVIDALDANFEGYEKEKHLLSAAPKFGNNDPYVDDIVDMVLEKCSKIANKAKGFADSTSGVAAAAITANIGLGVKIGALPGGRMAGTPFADGGLSPYHGRNVSGPSATMMSVARLNALNFTNGSVLNMRFEERALEKPGGMDKFMKMIRAYLESGGFLVQFNLTSAETYRDAQKNPELYRDLIVRVATYSAYFVELSKKLQQDIINRTIFEAP